jgi:hypothetical protein
MHAWGITQKGGFEFAKRRSILTLTAQVSLRR